MTDVKTAVRFKRGPNDEDGVNVSLVNHQGEMILTFDKPVEAILMTVDDLATMNHVFANAVIWLTMHQDDADKTIAN